MTKKYKNAYQVKWDIRFHSVSKMGFSDEDLNFSVMKSW